MPGRGVEGNRLRKVFSPLEVGQHRLAGRVVECVDHATEKAEKHELPHPDQAVVALLQHEPTRRYYLKHGYTVAAHIPDYYAENDGQVIFLKRL